MGADGGHDRVRVEGWSTSVPTLEPAVDLRCTDPAGLAGELSSALQQAGLRIIAHDADGFRARRRRWRGLALALIGGGGDVETTTVTVAVHSDHLEVRVQPADRRRPDSDGVITALDCAISATRARGLPVTVGEWHRAARA